MVLRKMFGPKKEEMAGERRKLHKDEFYYPYSSSNIPVIYSSIIRWAGYAERIGGEERCIQRFHGKT
jgi:hypothetical protein